MSKSPRFTDASLVKALEHPNRWVRLTAQRLLAEVPRVDGLDPQRCGYLTAHLKALACAARKFAGEDVGFVVEIVDLPLSRNAGRVAGGLEQLGDGDVRDRVGLVAVDRELAERHYAVHRERPFFSSLVRFMSSGPAIVMVLEAEDAIRKWRFRPFTRDGQPVKAVGFVSFNFNP